MENAEINNIIKIVGLQYKKNYEDEESLKSLRYGKIMIMTDQVRFTKIENWERKINTWIQRKKEYTTFLPLPLLYLILSLCFFLSFHILVGHSVFSATKQNR